MASKKSSSSKAAAQSSVADSAASNEKAKSNKQANVIWRGEKDPTAFDGYLLNGMEKIKVPSIAEQRKGFHSPDAVTLTRLKNGYKILTPKG